MKASKNRIPGQSIRNTWQINPRTRVHDNDIRKNQKKFRQMSKKELQNLMKQNQKTSPQKDWFDFNQLEVVFNFFTTKIIKITATIPIMMLNFSRFA